MLSQARKGLKRKMSRRLRQVKSDFACRFTSGKIRVKTERSRTPLRFSRRLRHLPPEYIQYYDTIRDQLQQARLDRKHVISKESSIQFKSAGRTRPRSLHYPHGAVNSKEVISILSAPKLRNRKSASYKRMKNIATKARGSSCKAEIVVNSSETIRPRFTVSKHSINVKRERSPETEKLLKKRKRYVLEVLNKGDMKDIEKLPSVGSKTAERIILYRQLKGSINKISELARMPKFPKRRFHNFIAQNFLYAD